MSEKVTSQLYGLNLTITEKCNLNCKHCGANGVCSSFNNNIDEELTTSEYYSVIRQSSELGCKHIIIAGGEPFLRNDIWDIIEYASDYGISCAILSNGSLIDEQVAKRLGRINNISYIRLSVDYATDEKMDAFRGMKGLKTKVFESVRLLRSCDVKTGVGMTIMDDNLDDILQLAKLANESGANFFRAVPIMPIGKSKNIKVDKQFFIESLKQVLYVAEEFQDLYFSTVILPDDLSEVGQTFLIGCPGGDRMASLTSNGSVSRCPLSGIFYNKDTVRNKPLKNLLQQLYNEKRNYVSTIENNPENNCFNCGKKDICHGGCLAEREARQLSSSENQPFCIKEIWESTFKVIRNEPKLRRVVNNMVCLHATQNMYKIPTCYRSLPIWWFPFSGKVKEHSFK